MDEKFTLAYADCCALTLFRDIREKPLFASFENILYLLITSHSDFAVFEILSAIADFFYKLCDGDAEANWALSLKKLIVTSENPFTFSIERITSSEMEKNKDFAIINNTSDFLRKIAEIDIERLKRLSLFPVSSFFDISVSICEKNTIPVVAFDKYKFIYAKFSDEYELSLFELSKIWNRGVGIMGQSDAFVWEANGLLPVHAPDPITLDQFIGYENQRSLVFENTRRFADGFTANNLLLYGDRGTGKSATVKAVATALASHRIKIIEVRKQTLGEFPRIIEVLRNRNFKFIIFIDDLSFDKADETYIGLKALLEGGLETRPANILLYATSNRRHLVKEKVVDRVGLGSIDPETEIRAQDSMQEYLSLADRFGITIVFSTPLQNEYLEIVDGMIKNRMLKVDLEKVHSDALRWEKWYNGRSPRTARQFVDWLEGGQTAPWDCTSE